MTGTIISKILPVEGPSENDDNSIEPTGLVELEQVKANSPNNDVKKNSILQKSESLDAEFVPFRILGYNRDNIDMAHDHLQRIISGERIKEVIEALKISSKNLSRPAKTERQRKPRLKNF